MADEAKKGRLFMVPIDSSKHSERAFDWYLSHVYKPGDRVGIVHVHEPPHYNNEAFGVWGKLAFEKDVDYKKALSDSVEKSKKLVEKFEQKAKAVGCESESIVKSNQHGTGQTICNLAAEKNADGIVMGSRGLNLFRRTMLGSVSSYVLNHSNTAVTITPPKDAHLPHHVNVPHDDGNITNIL